MSRVQGVSKNLLFGNYPRAQSRGAQPTYLAASRSVTSGVGCGAPALVCGSGAEVMFLRREVQERGTKEARSRIAPGL